MTHPGSGNPTWQDWPSTQTPVDAFALENIETALDNTARGPVCEARLTSDYTGLVGGAWYTMSGRMAPPAGMDPYGMWSQPAGGGRYQLTVPTGWGGRYEVLWTINTINAGSRIVIAGVLLNCPASATDADAAGHYLAFRGQTPGFGTCVGSAVLDAGDRIGLAVHVIGSGGWDMTTVQGGLTRTKVVMRYVGPA